jgi:sialate O-acetylesterase
LGIPVGLIHSSWGGTLAEAWTSAEGLAPLSDFTEPLARFRAAVERKTGSASNNPNVTTVLYNGMIAPLLPFAIKGVIWYQGESNAGRAAQYRRLLPAMITDWRTRFGVGDFPFYIVQLAAFQATNPQPRDNEWAELREAQALTAKTLRNCGLAVAIDIGDAADIHPKDKLNVGHRLALNALAKTYGRKVEWSGPWYRSMKMSGDKVRLKFDHADGGLVAKGGKLTGFAVAGEDRKFVWADAEIEGDAVLVSSPSVPKPVAVRYAWDTNPVCSLFNQTGLPAVPFRTDEWPMLTRSAK